MNEHLPLHGQLISSNLLEFERFSFTESSISSIRYSNFFKNIGPAGG